MGHVECNVASNTEDCIDVSGNPLPDREVSPHDQTMDQDTFKNNAWQRVYQYLEQYDRQVAEFQVQAKVPFGTMQNCLEILLK